MTSRLGGFTDDQWETLLHGPLYVLAHVGGADAYVDSAEWDSLIEAVRLGAEHEDALVASIMGALAEHPFTESRELPGHDAPLAALDDIATVLEQQGDDSGLAYRTTLAEIAAAIADASGAPLAIRYATHHHPGGWLPVAATAPAERRAVETVAAALRLAVPASGDD